MIVSFSDMSIALGAVALAALSGSALQDKCGSLDQLSDRLHKSNQLLTATGWTASNDLLNLFVTPGKTRWTLTLTGPGGVTCPIARGTQFQDAQIDGYMTPVNRPGG